MRSLPAVFLTLNLLLAAAGAADISSTTYTLDSEFTSIWNGLGRDAQGNIYIAAGHRAWDYLSHEKDCAFFRFDFDKDAFVKIGTVRQVSEAADNWVDHTRFPAEPFDAAGKVHTSIREFKGKMYFATATTMDASTYGLELEFYPQFFRGSHLYEYDPETDRMRDMNAWDQSVMAPGNGQQDIAIDYHHDAIYGIGYPTGQVFRYDLKTGESRMVWQSPDGISNHNGGYVTRNLIIDRQGILWFAHGPRLVGYVNHLDEIEADVRMVVPFPESESSVTGHLQALAFTATRDTVYFHRQGVDKIYRFIPGLRKIDYIADARTSSLLMRWDLNRLYWTAVQRVETDQDSPSQSRRRRMTVLIEYDIATGQSRELEVGGEGMPRPDNHWCGNGDAVDRDGNLWFSNQGPKGGTVLKVDLGIPCEMCRGDVFSWGEPRRRSNTNGPRDSSGWGSSAGADASRVRESTPERRSNSWPPAVVSLASVQVG
jgi:hypothetical protein